MLNSLTKGIAVGAVVLVATVAGPTAAQAADHTIHQDNLTTLNGLANGDYGQAGHSFQQDGLHINVDNDGNDDSSNYVVLRWLTNTKLSQVHKVDYDWTGTANRPGIKYDVDVTGDGTVDCELIGEQAYGGQDVWLNKDSYQIPGSDLGDFFFDCAFFAPKTSSGSGSEYHGTLDEWATNLNMLAGIYNEDEGCDFGWEERGREGGVTPELSAPIEESGCPDVATVIEEGIGASGLVQKGVMTRVGLGPENYYFGYPAASAVAGPCNAVSGSYTFTRHIRTQQGRHGGRFVFTTGGTCSDQSVVWKVKLGQHVIKRFVQYAGGRAPFRFVNTNTYHGKTVTILRDGVVQGRYGFDAAPRG